MKNIKIYNTWQSEYFLYNHWVILIFNYKLNSTFFVFSVPNLTQVNKMTACGNWKKKKLLNKCTYSLPFFTKLSFKIKSILLYNMGTCGQDPIWCLWLLLPPPLFFFLNFHFMKKVTQFFVHVHNILQLTFYVILDDIYTINTIKQ